jgi:hypothetical protein
LLRGIVTKKELEDADIDVEDSAAVEEWVAKQNFTEEVRLARAIAPVLPSGLLPLAPSLLTPPSPPPSRTTPIKCGC